MDFLFNKGKISLEVSGDYNRFKKDAAFSKRENISKIRRKKTSFY